MKLLEAHVNGNPRQVNTKYGEKAVMDVVTADGTEIAIWRPAGDMDVMGRMNGERVSIVIDSKGKASLVEHASTKPQAAQNSNTTTEQPSRSGCNARRGSLGVRCTKERRDRRLYSAIGQVIRALFGCSRTDAENGGIRNAAD